jgi:Kef-type K+ transport system membrane component KefB
MTDTHQLLTAIDPVILLLSLGVVAVVITRHIGLSPIVGYLAIGLALRVAGHTVFQNSSTIEVLSELGVVFLLFDIGLHFSVSRIKEQAANILGFGPLQVVLGSAVIGLGAYTIFGLSIPAAFLVGATFALSSTAVVDRLIHERHQRSCPVGLTAIAILIFQDVAAIAILVVVTALQGSNAVALPVAFALTKAFTAFAAAALMARFVVRPVLVLIVRTQNEEIFTAVALLVALAAGWVTAAVGLSMTLGAFLGGVILADTPYRAVIQSEIKPFRGLLLGFFFISVGLSVDPATVIAYWPIIIIVAVLVMSGKVLSNMAASLIFRWSTPGSMQLGFLIAQASEFAFVILSLPTVRVLLGEKTTSVLIASVALTLAATPTVADVGRRIAGALRARAARQHDPELIARESAAPVLVFGMGARGRAVADALLEFGIGYLGVESDEKLLRNAIADGYAVIFGRVDDPRLWQSMAIEGRKLNVLSDPDFETAADILPSIREEHPELSLLAAALNADDARHFAAIGIETVDDSFGDGTPLGKKVLTELGIDQVAIEEWLAKRRRSITADVREAA